MQTHLCEQSDTVGPLFLAVLGTGAQVPGQPERRAIGWRWSECLAYAAELVGDAGGVDAVLRQHPGVLGVAGVGLVWQLAGGLAGLVVLALAAQQVRDLAALRQAGLRLRAARSSPVTRR